ncbi:MAG: hypothetical protein WAO76_07410, partial [Georgfuchsia sp.]
LLFCVTHKESTMHKQHKSRNPAGLDTKHPIALRLMSAERADAERIAAKMGTTLSALARLAYLEGLSRICKPKTAPAAATGEPRGKRA